MRQKIKTSQFLNGVAVLYSEIEKNRNNKMWSSHIKILMVRGRVRISISQLMQPMSELKRIFGVRFVPEYKFDSYEYFTGNFFTELEITDS